MSVVRRCSAEGSGGFLRNFKDMQKELYLTLLQAEQLKRFLSSHYLTQRVTLEAHTSVASLPAAGSGKSSAQEPPKAVSTAGFGGAQPSESLPMSRTLVRRPDLVRSDVKYVWTTDDAGFYGACAVMNALQMSETLGDGFEEATCSKNMAETQILLAVFRQYPHSARFFPDEVDVIEKERQRIIGIIGLVKSQTGTGGWVALRPLENCERKWIVLDSSNTVTYYKSLRKWRDDKMSDDGVIIAVRKAA